MAVGQSSTFLLSGGSSAWSSVLGVWEATPDDLEAAVSFDLGTTSSPQAVVFLSDLPSDLERASDEIDRAEANLLASQAALADAQVRLDALVRTQSGGVSFDTQGEAPAPGSPESEALALLRYTGLGSELDFASYSPGEDKSGQWEKVNTRFREFLQQLDRIVGHAAWIETRQSGRLQVRSSVGWTGNLDTAWSTLPTPDLSELHQRTLGLALASRIAMLRTFAVISAGAVKLAAMVATPAGAILALPAAWNFFRQVQVESARYTSIKEEIENGQ